MKQPLARILPITCLFALVAGCADPKKGPVVFYLDGAGWYASSGSVEAGLRKAGYRGEFDLFSWSSFLGPAHDHFVSAHNKATAQRLANKIERLRQSDPAGAIHVMGLSAGTAVILSALEELKDSVQVDDVVLFSPTVSAQRDLTKIMRHVRRNLYATSSPHDAIVASLAVNADGKSGPPAGRSGFKMPTKAGEKAHEAYRRVVNLPWQPSYVGFNWNGSHTSATSSDFVAAVIAPRVLSDEPYPLDRSIFERVAVNQPDAPARESPMGAGK